FHGDNKDVLAYLLANGFRGKVKLIYIDPPFDSGADYVRKVQLWLVHKDLVVVGLERISTRAPSRPPPSGCRP
ncbi:MAG: hypothetical protein WCH04_16210, partial [Gammaproteobacteria bacterium]